MKEINLEKNLLRQEIRRKRQDISSRQRMYLSERIMAKLTREPFFKIESATFLYASIPEEVQLYGLIEFMLAFGRKVAVPFISEQNEMIPVEVSSIDDLTEDRYGILTVREDKRIAISPDSIGLIIVPGVAFTKQGDRLGMGAGFYDRFLSKVSAFKVALAFDCQIVDNVPTLDYDEKVDYIITESQTILTNKTTNRRKDDIFCKDSIL